MLGREHQPSDQQPDPENGERRYVHQPPPGNEHSRAFLRQDQPGGGRGKQEASHRQRAALNILRAPPHVGQTQGHPAEHHKVGRAPPLASGQTGPVPPGPGRMGPAAGRTGCRGCGWPACRGRGRPNCGGRSWAACSGWGWAACRGWRWAACRGSGWAACRGWGWAACRGWRGRGRHSRDWRSRDWRSRDWRSRDCCGWRGGGRGSGRVISLRGGVAGCGRGAPGIRPRHRLGRARP
jgi:hypothetical protein